MMHWFENEWLWSSLVALLNDRSLRDAQQGPMAYKCIYRMKDGWYHSRLASLQSQQLSSSASGEWSSGKCLQSRSLVPACPWAAACSCVYDSVLCLCGVSTASCLCSCMHTNSCCCERVCHNYPRGIWRGQRIWGPNLGLNYFYLVHCCVFCICPYAQHSNEGAAVL